MIPDVKHIAMMAFASLALPRARRALNPERLFQIWLMVAATALSLVVMGGISLFFYWWVLEPPAVAYLSTQYQTGAHGGVLLEASPPDAQRAVRFIRFERAVFVREPIAGTRVTWWRCQDGETYDLTAQPAAFPETGLRKLNFKAPLPDILPDGGAGCTFSAALILEQNPLGVPHLVPLGSVGEIAPGPEQDGP